MGTDNGGRVPVDVVWHDGSVTIHNGLVLDESKFLATLYGHDLGLTALEFRLLRFLAACPGRVYNRQQILDRVYPDQRAVNDRAINNHIKNLQKNRVHISRARPYPFRLWGGV